MALISDDFPTLERPAKAISTGAGGGNPSSATTPRSKRIGPANRSRPFSMSSSLKPVTCPARRSCV
jgi:hypothetical protein